MPRDGSQIYHRPPGTDGVPNYTVESARYNAFTADVEQDLNLPRPVIAGGTGANNPADAINNLGGELSKQLIVNYNSDPIQAGSFYSAAGATGAPTVNAFAGICYVAVISGLSTTDLFIEARDEVTGNLWVRQKKANVWQPWSQAAGVTTGATPPASVSPNTLWWDPTRGKLFIYYQDVDSAQWVEAVAVPDVDPNTFVEIAGDTMNGPLILFGDPTLPLGSATKQYVDAGVSGKAVRYDIAQGLTAPQQLQARQNISAPLPVGRCVLIKSGANLMLMPKNGNLLTINGVACSIPAAGLSLAPTGLTPSTLYYIYAVATAGVVTSLEASTTGHGPDPATSANAGVEIKTGDPTRSLVGMAYCGAGPAWFDATGNRLVRSWFNRPRMPIFSAILGSNVGLSSGFTTAALSLCNCVAWADDAIDIHLNFLYFATVAGTLTTSILVDGSQIPSSPGSVINTDPSGRVLPGTVSTAVYGNIVAGTGAEGFHNIGFGGTAAANVSYYSQSFITATVG
jgi:hypothetical protein